MVRQLIISWLRLTGGDRPLKNCLGTFSTNFLGLFTHRIRMYGILMVTFTINIPQMLAFFFHTWILWVIEYAQKSLTVQDCMICCALYVLGALHMKKPHKLYCMFDVHYSTLHCITSYRIIICLKYLIMLYYGKG